MTNSTDRIASDLRVRHAYTVIEFIPGLHPRNIANAITGPQDYTKCFYSPATPTEKKIGDSATECEAGPGPWLASGKLIHPQIKLSVSTI
jgi:hypothetical protein